MKNRFMRLLALMIAAGLFSCLISIRAQEDEGVDDDLPPVWDNGAVTTTENGGDDAVLPLPALPDLDMPPPVDAPLDQWVDDTPVVPDWDAPPPVDEPVDAWIDEPLPPAAIPPDVDAPAAPPVIDAPPAPDQVAPVAPYDPPAADVAEVVAVDEPPAPESRSFFGRLFGRRQRRDEPPPAEITAKDALDGLPAAPDRPLSPEELLAAQEEVRRQARELEAFQNFERGQELMERNEFENAVRAFARALELMPRRPHTVEVRDQMRMHQAECEYRVAMREYRDGNLSEARAALRRAMGYYPAHARSMRLEERLRSEEARRQEIALKPVPKRLEPEHVAKTRDIREALDRGNQYMAISEFDKAEREFNFVLQKNPVHPDAVAQMRRLADRRYRRSADSMRSFQEEMLAQVKDTWTPPVRRVAAQPRDTGIDPTGVDPTRRRRLMEKLDTIVIPSLDFRQANIIDVIKYIDEQAIAADRDSPPSERGINIVLNLQRPGQPSPAAPVPRAMEIDPFADVGMPPPSSAVGVPTVTLSLRNVKLLDAIRFITEMTGLRHRIEGDVVMITPADVVVGEVVTRTYKVQPGVISEHIMSSAPASTGGGLFDLGGPVRDTSGGGDIKQFFVEAGVPFPEGTSIVYKPSMNLIIVSNTAENLERFERILNMLNVVPVQVEIEARFVEVQQSDLAELGMEWLLTDNWVVAQESGPGAPLPLSARERVQVNRNNLTKGLRYFDGVGETMAPRQRGTAAGILSVSSILTSPQLSFVLHALEQRSGVNLLSAPKVTTRTGSNAEIKVVEELIYPMDFEITPAQTLGTTGAQSFSPPFVTPTGFEQRDTGVILNVTPTVGPDNYTIDLVMMPQVVELARWINYGSAMPDGRGGFIEMNLPQPVFHSRTIVTSISIWDGQTVVMGGLITEGQQTSEDKIPLLGDIPLLGWFFRSRTTKSIKRNLLIFVTANLVDPAGNKVNQDTDMTPAAADFFAETPSL